jgi:hypothetical protein
VGRSGGFFNHGFHGFKGFHGWGKMPAREIFQGKYGSDRWYYGWAWMQKKSTLEFIRAIRLIRDGMKSFSNRRWANREV